MPLILRNFCGFNENYALLNILVSNFKTSDFKVRNFDKVQIKFT